MGDESSVGLQPCFHCLRPLQSASSFKKHVVIFNRGYNLSIEQTVVVNGLQEGRELHISGRLDVRSSGETGTTLLGQHLNTGRVEIEIASGDARLTAATSIHRTDQQVITISTPFAVDWWGADGPRPCVTMHIVLYAPVRGGIDTLVLKVANLDISLAKSLKLYAVGTTIITAESGKIHVPFPKSRTDEKSPYILQSRQIIVNTISGNIEGWFPLHHLLKIQSASGNVLVEVGLESTFLDSATHAKLFVETISGTVGISAQSVFHGNIWCRRPKKQPPARDYVVEVTTVTGIIDAHVVIASRGVFHSTAGNLSLELLPLLFSSSGDGQSRLETVVKSGFTSIFMLEPLLCNVPCNNDASLMMTGFNHSLGLTCLQSYHQSIGGRINVEYPQSWTGEFSAETCGKVNVEGQSIMMTHSNQGVPGMMGGMKGQGTSTVCINSNSGDVALHFDDS
ncbi:uncharacterized protein CPUR_00836 [Claviceps purpurea 20.1]|uniref:Adhesin domain-containing protein n=1 Tax=Claviceps purpurea (strain 20.1) TaxID=1111077 RepID=M1VU91_CLAP2|nr:uncharacterized protein CPUR_00836 [Claviceps purpurea 20.1]